MDHKRIGILYSTTAFAFFLLAGIESLAMRVQLARPDSTVIGARTYSELLCIYRFAMEYHHEPHVPMS